MKRHASWEKLLFEHIESVGPFEWGTNDCCMFSVGCVEAITGVNFGTEYTGYKTKIGAARRLSDNGGVEGIATKHLGDAKNKKFANRGDVVLFDQGEGDSLGICLGDKIAVIGEHGVQFISMNLAKKVWSV